MFTLFCLFRCQLHEPETNTVDNKKNTSLLRLFFAFFVAFLEADSKTNPWHVPPKFWDNSGK